MLNRDWEHLSSDQGRGGVVGLEELTPEQQADQDAMNDAGAGKMMLTIDPPEHTRYRKLVNRGFTPRVIRSLEDHLRESSKRIIDRALAKDDGKRRLRRRRRRRVAAGGDLRVPRRARTRIGTSCSSGPTG